MDQVKDFVRRNYDRDPKGNLSVTSFIVQAIRERFGKLERAKRSGQRQRASKKGGVLHPSADNLEYDVSALADSYLSARTGRQDGDGQSQ
jgi:hypothetical protein